jgi:hypothetical protein
MKERTVLALKLISSHILLLPVLLTIGELFPPISIYIYSIAETIFLILFLTGYWEFFGLKFRTSYSVLIELILFLLIINRVINPVNYYHGWTGLFLFIVIEFYLVTELLKIFMVILKREKGSFEISFPFKEGKYLITDGGNSRTSRLMNYHFYSGVHKRKGTNYSMMFATDIVRLDPPLKAFLPTSNRDYPIFENQVYSPMGGTVFKVINDIDDNLPYSGNYPYNTGNTIVLKEANLFLLIGHLKKGSIIVREGDFLQKNEIIAKAGNSGYSERPHIHMQLINSESDNYWSGLGTSITYRQRNLYKNRIILTRHIG